MRKRRNILIMSISAIVAVAIIAGGVWWGIGRLSPSGKDKAERFFQRDKADLVLVADYFADRDYPVVRITSADGLVFAGYPMEIEDQVVRSAIERLFNKRGYKSIDKIGNTIIFHKWTRLMDFGSGITYSMNGEDAPVLQFLTKLEPLSEKGWYYYEEDYNEWRERQ